MIAGGYSYEECRGRLRSALARLAESVSGEAMLRAAPQELVDACGFTRVMMSAIRGSHWMPLHLHTRPELHLESDAFVAFIDSGADIPLVNLLVETEVVRKRAAVLVDESLIRTRAFQPIVELAQSPAYVAAPFIIEGRVVGVVHADRIGQERVVDDDDRAHVEAFCAEASVIYQCLVWNERIAQRGRRAREELDRLRAVLNRIEDPAFAHSAPFEESSPFGTDAGDRPESDLPGDGTLTARERDVLRHVADGSTNLVIAQRLSISEDTVKTHMRSVLRKLRVSTRGAAVARYLDALRESDA